MASLLGLKRVKVSQPEIIKKRRIDIDVEQDTQEPQENLNHEELLRKFDCASKYGPRLNMSRIDRYRRAQKFGRQPPPELEAVFAQDLKAAEFVWTLQEMMRHGSQQ
eukprot:GGOE01018920.1.p2 GENE.GGOE01018920.1~~GGOE01018920.1.p2  ORF type:complete len:107 (-),score=22.36 GGOE01018920.1:304-624(-)